VSIVQIPSHQRKHLGKEDLAGDLLRLSSARAIGTPGAGIPVFCLTGADRQYFAFLIDQHLHIIYLRESIQAGSIYIEFIVVKGHGWLIDMGKEFPAYHLVAL